MLTLSRMDYLSYDVFLSRDLDMQCVCRLYDFNQAQLIRPGVAYRIAGTVNSSSKHYLMVESVRPDTKHTRFSSVPDPVDGAGGSATS